MANDKNDKNDKKDKNDQEKRDDENVVDILGRASAGEVDAGLIARLVRLLRRSLRFSRDGLTLSGQGMADLLLSVAPKLPIRDIEALHKQYGGLNDIALAGQLIRVASRNSAAVGGTTGALASMGELAPPFWVMLPLEVIAETMIISAIEMRMVAELHNVFGFPFEGAAPDRGVAILESWSQQRGISPDELAKDGGISKALSKGARAQMIQVVRRKLFTRTARNVSSLAPLLIGAVAGAEINRRSTRDLGDHVVGDLSALEK